MRKERKILRFVLQKLRKSFANGNPKFNIFVNCNKIYHFPSQIFVEMVCGGKGDFMVCKNRLQKNFIVGVMIISWSVKVQ